MDESEWLVFTSEELSEKVEGSQPRLFEFLCTPGLSAVAYRLPAGSIDVQAPHLEDEVYLVLSGRAGFRVADHECKVAPGNILFVRAGVVHSYFDIEEDLTVVAVFGAQSRTVPNAAYLRGQERDGRTGI